MRLQHPDDKNRRSNTDAGKQPALPAACIGQKRESGTSFFNVVRVHNTGAAFSFLANAGGWQRWLFTGIGLAAAIFIIWMLKSHPGQKLFSFALACILGGAIGNVIDRTLYGYVVDFLDFHYAGWHFPAFNIADSTISIGAVCLILDELLRVRKSR